VRDLRRFLEEVDLLVLTGGIGPTPDDITRDAVAEVAGVPLIVHPEAKAALEARPYKGSNPEYRMLMAQVPQGATLIPNPLSPAPGFYIGRMAVFPGVGIGSYPTSEGEYRVRVVFRGERFDRTDACSARFTRLLSEIGYEVLRRVEERGEDA
jgi:molybdopterin-biosynthesis enzyme MoeA-like protein